MTAFAIRVVASFVVAGIWIGAATLIAERHGSKIGGLVGNLPSTIVVSFIFITLTQNLLFTTKAAQAVPVGMTIDTVFMLLFILGARVNLATGITVSLAGWLAMAYAASRLGLPSWLTGSIICIAACAGVFLVMERGLRFRTQSARLIRYSPGQIVARMVLAGTVVAVSVIVANFAGPYWTGLFSTFPAVMLSTLTILYMVQGWAFSAGTAKVLTLSAPNILAFALVASRVFPRGGLLAGMLAGYAAAAVFVAVLRPVVARIS
jgi:hypothetical protein